MQIVGKGLADSILHVVLFRVLCFMSSVKKQYVENILQRIWETFLHEKKVIVIATNVVTNSFLSFNCSLIEINKNKSQIFRKLFW